MQSVITVRKCKGLDEFNACVELQKEVWKFNDLELIPVSMFVLAEEVGGQIIGAFAGSTLAGFVLAIVGNRSGRPYLYSQMMAVRETFRNRGLGRLMKLAQRDDAIQRGFELIEWTFDPLEIGNAWFNVAKLGAISRRYHVNHYGYTSSVLHRGLPTDRLVAEWWLRSKRVSGLLEGKQEPEFETIRKAEIPGETDRRRNSSDDLTKVADVQERTRGQLTSAFGEGLAVLGYERDQAGNGTYLLGHWDED